MLTLDEDQKLLVESARGAVSTHAPIAEYRKLRAPGGEGFSREFWRRCAELGFAGVLVPEDFGGSPFGAVGAGLIAREMGRQLVLSPFLSTAVLSATALAVGAHASIQAEWLPRIAAGEAILGFACDEDARPSGEPPATKAERCSDGWRLTGTKHWVLDGHVAEAFLVTASSEGEEPALFVVGAGAAGLSRDERTLVDGRRAATVKLDAVVVGDKAKLALGTMAIERALDVGRAVLAASLCGVAEQAFARTLGYLKERRQFERRIGSFQALQHRAAKAHIEVENAWSATLKALEAIDAVSNTAAFDVAVAKAKASEVGCAVTAECLQMHGGIGMTDEFDIGLYLKRSRVDSVLFGDHAFHADRVATMLGY